MKNHQDKEIQQVIVVEGKTDTQKLKTIFGSTLQTIETNGLALTNQTITLIQQINYQKGIIIFTDPDGPGKKIRQSLNEKLTGEIKNAFITKTMMKKGAKKIGIAEADEQAIIDALSNLITFKKQQESLSWKEYLTFDFYLKVNRQLISEHFHFDQNMSSKTLFKWLNLMGLTAKELDEILKNNKGKS